MKPAQQTDILTIELPKGDLSFLKSISKRLGWKISAGKEIHKTNYERSMDDVKHGRITEYKDADDMFAKLGI